MSCDYPSIPCIKSKICINSIYFCDGQNDCLFGEDEINCSKLNFPKFICAKNSNEKISFLKVCNHVNDCSDGSDEIFCSNFYLVFFF